LTEALLPRRDEAARLALGGAGVVGEGQGRLHGGRGLLHQVDVLHEEIQLHLGGELSSNDHGAAHLQHGGGRRARVEHVQGDVEIETGLAREGQSLGGGGAVQRDQEIGDELERHGLANSADEDGARQNGLEHGAPAVIESPVASHEEDAVAALDHGAGSAHGAIEEAQALGRDLTRVALGERGGDRAHLHDREARARAGQDAAGTEHGRFGRRQGGQDCADGLGRPGDRGGRRCCLAADGREGRDAIREHIEADHRMARSDQSRGDGMTEKPEPDDADRAHGASFTFPLPRLGERGG